MPRRWWLASSGWSTSWVAGGSAVVGGGRHGDDTGVAVPRAATGGADWAGAVQFVAAQAPAKPIAVSDDARSARHP